MQKVKLFPVRRNSHSKGESTTLPDYVVQALCILARVRKHDHTITSNEDVTGLMAAPD